MSIINSKKFVASALASILAMLGLYLEMPIDQILTVIAPLGVYTVGQGIADHGKEKAKVQNGNG